MRLLIVSEGPSELDGALRTLVQRLLGEAFDSDARRVSDPSFRGLHGKGGGYFKRAIRCMQYAQNNGYDGVVLVIDQDDERERHRQFDEAQRFQRLSVRRALGVAVRMFDAWMLADEVALGRVLGSTVQRQPDPETIRAPKGTCGNLCEGHAWPGGLGDLYRALADVTDLAVVEERCPRGFAVFAQRVRQM